MKISVVTAVFNRQKTIGDAIASVASQTCTDLEYVTIDGMSNDGTSDVIQASADVIDCSIRERDSGIYDALNKGITRCTGDVVGFLHADDLFADSNVIERVRNKFLEGTYDAVYGDLTYVAFDDPNRVIRYWKSGEFNRARFRRGWMPPHPTVYVRKEVYEKLGAYRTDFGSGADYECMIRLLYCRPLRIGYIPHVQVKMRVGGESNVSLQNRLNANHSDRQAWIQNDQRPPIGLRFTKPLSKLLQYIRRPANPRPENE